MNRSAKNHYPFSSRVPCTAALILVGLLIGCSSNLKVLKRPAAPSTVTAVTVHIDGKCSQSDRFTPDAELALAVAATAFRDALADSLHANGFILADSTAQADMDLRICSRDPVFLRRVMTNYMTTPPETTTFAPFVNRVTYEVSYCDRRGAETCRVRRTTFCSRESIAETVGIIAGYTRTIFGRGQSGPSGTMP